MSPPDKYQEILGIQLIWARAMRSKLSPSSSWPGSSRPSTSFLCKSSKDVDARHKAGHDELR
jgi:hypothetical protein